MPYGPNQAAFSTLEVLFPTIDLEDFFCTLILLWMGNLESLAKTEQPRSRRVSHSATVSSYNCLKFFVGVAKFGIYIHKMVQPSFKKSFEFGHGVDF